MTAIAIAVFVVLSAIAGLHVAWGLGLRWPARDERGLVALVIGATGRTRMPALAQSVTAAAAIFAAGIVALMLTGLTPVPPLLTAVAGVLATLVFAGRGVAAFVPAWRRKFSQQPFARLDRAWYGPLCLLIAFAFAALTAARTLS